MTMTTNNFADMDALLESSMDDMDDLPPVGVPPTGHYNLTVSAERKMNQDGTSEYIQFSYIVENVNEVKNSEEENQAAIGMKFNENFSPIKKDGTVNTFGIGFLKERLIPFANHYNTRSTGELLGAIQGVTIAATLIRKENKKDPGRFDFKLSDVIIL